MRSGTLNVPGIVGLGARVRDLPGRDGGGKRAAWRGCATGCSTACRPQLDGVIVNGSLERRLPNNLHVSFDGVDGESLLIGIGDIAVSSGSACSSASEAPVARAARDPGRPRARPRRFGSASAASRPTTTSTTRSSKFASVVRHLRIDGACVRHDGHSLCHVGTGLAWIRRTRSPSRDDASARCSSSSVSLVGACSCSRGSGFPSRRRGSVAPSTPAGPLERLAARSTTTIWPPADRSRRSRRLSSRRSSSSSVEARRRSEVTEKNRRKKTVSPEHALAGRRGSCRRSGVRPADLALVHVPAGLDSGHRRPGAGGAASSRRVRSDARRLRSCACRRSETSSGTASVDRRLRGVQLRRRRRSGDGRADRRPVFIGRVDPTTDDARGRRRCCVLGGSRRRCRPARCVFALDGRFIGMALPTSGRLALVRRPRSTRVARARAAAADRRHRRPRRDFASGHPPPRARRTRPARPAPRRPPRRSAAQRLAAARCSSPDRRSASRRRSRPP